MYEHFLKQIEVIQEHKIRQWVALPPCMVAYKKDMKKQKGE